MSIDNDRTLTAAATSGGSLSKPRRQRHVGRHQTVACKMQSGWFLTLLQNNNIKWAFSKFCRERGCAALNLFG